MSIKVKHISFAYDKTKVSVEDMAAEQLQKRLEKDLLSYNNSTGTIYILTSIRLFGQKRNDIDILVIGLLNDFRMSNLRINNFGLISELTISSFITNIELKSHPASKVYREGSDYIVTYSNGKHNASQQCNEAKFSLVNHLEDQLNIKAFISDMLWLNGLSKEDIISLRGDQMDNALPLDFSFKDMVSVILQQAIPTRGDYKYYCLDTFKGGKTDFDKIIKLFTEKREPQGLTKKKFELISQQSTDIDKIRRNIGDKLAIVKGRAGTGKTIQLLQLAFLLANEDNAKRCVILTYNNALVCDIKRLIDYTPMPTKVDGRTVSIKTIDSFFQTLMRETGVLSGPLSPTYSDYKHQYEANLQELSDYVVDKCSVEDIATLKDMADAHIDWDYILVDEAQDFSDLEKEILFKIYGAKRIIVADGVDQFMRRSRRQLWDRGMTNDMVWKPKSMELERRQKANLVIFANAFAKAAGLDWNVRPNPELPGGQIKIYPTFNTKHFNNLKANCQKNKCENYDILMLFPPSRVEYDKKGNRKFELADLYIKAGIPIFDGINNQLRTTYPTKDQCRVYQYDSCRGLEGWCVVCAEFDELIQYKMNTVDVDDDTLGFDKDLAKKKIVYLWSLMPLTRPIDTLIITLKDPKSEVGKLLKELANIFEDFIEWGFQK